MESTLENQKKNAQLASAFASDHPNSNIRSVEDFYKFVQNNPNIAEAWIQTKEDIPVERRVIQELASSFQALDHLEYLENLPEQKQPEHEKNPFENAWALAAPFALRNNDVKLAGDALTQASPDVNLYSFVPTGISSTEDFQNTVKQIEDTKVQELQAKNPQKQLKKTEIQEHLSKEYASTQAHALNQFVGTSAERSEKVRDAREKDLYIKDDKGKIIGEKIFKNKKNNPNPWGDPVFRTYQEQKSKAIEAALAKYREEKRKGIKQKYSEEDLRTMITYQYDGHFAAMFPEKATAYAKQDDRLQQSLKTLQKAEKRIEKREQMEAKKKIKTAEKVSQPPPAKQSANPIQTNKPAPKQHKSARTRQKEWNSQKIANAVLHGYNPKTVLNNLVSWKAWKSKTWKYGKYAVLGPTVAGSMDLYSWQKNRRNNAGIASNTGLAQPTKTRTMWRVFSARTFSRMKSNPGSPNAQGSNPAANLGKTAAKKIASQLANKAIAQVRDKAISALLENPVSLLIIGIVLLVILVIIMVLIVVVTAISGGGEFNDAGGLAPPGPGNGTNPPNTNPIPGFTINKNVDKTQINFDPANPERITYTISYSYTPASGATIQLSDITISDKVSDGAKFISASGNANFDNSTNTVTWKLSDSNNASPLTLVVEPINDNIIISNKATAMTMSAQSSTTPNSDTCNGYYTLTSPSSNFGDPNCDFATDSKRIQAQDAIGNVLKSQDPNNADAWFTIIIPGESGWNPNAFNGSSTSGNGAYGLYQMNPQGKSTSGQYDIGNVGWLEQTTNAMGLASVLRNNGIPYAPPRGYWEAWSGVNQK